MHQGQLFVLEGEGARQLTVPPFNTFDTLYQGCDLGVYTAVRTFEHNQFLYLDQHIARTVQSMQHLGWDYELDESRLRRHLHRLCTGFPAAEMRVRFDILATPPNHWDTNSRELIALIPFELPPAHLYTAGVRVAVAQSLHRETPLAKTAAFAAQRKQYHFSADAYEYLMLTEAGAILEGTNTNFYAVRDGCLYTAGSGVLEGVTRRILLSLAAALNIPVHLEAVPLAEAHLFEEAAISASSRGLVPVVKIGEQVIGDGRPGPICQRLLSAYNTFVSQEIKTAIP